MAVTGKAFTHPGDWVATILGDAVFFTLAATFGFFVTLQYKRAQLETIEINMNSVGQGYSNYMLNIARNVSIYWYIHQFIRWNETVAMSICKSGNLPL